MLALCACAAPAPPRAVRRRASLRVREARGLTCAYKHRRDPAAAPGKTLQSTADELQATREEKAILHERVAEARRALTVSKYAPAPRRVRAADAPRAGARKAKLKHAQCVFARLG